MLTRIFGNIFRRQKKSAVDEARKMRLLQKASDLMQQGDRKSAVIEFRKYLELDPYNVPILNNLGVCLADSGNMAEADAAFSLAYSLDDTYIPVVVNHAKTLVERRRSDEALPFLEQAKIYDPGSPYSDAVYGAVCLNNGEVAKSRHFQFRAWMADFDNLRIANCYLFYSSYADIDEITIASEHRFWAETGRPIDLSSSNVQGSGEPKSKAIPLLPLETNVPGNDRARKIKIGYLSPDFRSHSVRYFFRPLLENHDKLKYDIYIYHDFSGGDDHTEAIKSAASSFHAVDELPDADLYRLITSHQLDVLVELAGHSSFNRISLFKNRFAPVQISALGYPPTTGLNTIDAKILDKYVVTPASNEYYAERPVALPDSFWCFDPMVDVPELVVPPFQENGYITFGCAGNIAKISDRILQCWKEILALVSESRLLIRSISFEEASAEAFMIKRLEAVGIDMSRVLLKKPESAIAFFSSYAEIDIILDTFPFNGGTTTCFAVYMGVPVVSLVGESLLGRMGLSVLSNMGVPDLAVYDDAAYIERAISLANDRPFLQEFRKGARKKFRESSLGNGEAYARDFERACATLLEQASEKDERRNEVPLLPPNEIIRRAYAVLRNGQENAAQRILDHCLKYYPHYGAAHLLAAQLMVGQNNFEESISYLKQRLNDFSTSDRFASLLNIIRWNILSNKLDEAAKLVGDLSAVELKDEFDAMQLRLYRAYCSRNKNSVVPIELESNEARNIHLLIPCDDIEDFNAIKSNILSVCWRPDKWSVNFERCEETRRTSAYEAVWRRSDLDILVIVQKTTKIHNAMFFLEIVEALHHNDVVGVAGAFRWNRIDWRGDAFDAKVAGFMVNSSEKSDAVEIQLLGVASECVVRGLAVLDGGLLAAMPARLKAIEFDAELDGAEWMLEEDWSHSVFLAGGRLAVHRNLGVLMNRRTEQNIHARAAGLLRIQEKHHFDLFSVDVDDTLLVSAPVKDMAEGIQVMRKFFQSKEQDKFLI